MARNPDKTFVIDKVDDLTFTIHTGKNGDPSQPISYPAFPYLLATQWAMMASPTWLDEVKARPDQGSPAGGHRAVHPAELRAA